MSAIASVVRCGLVPVLGALLLAACTPEEPVGVVVPAPTPGREGRFGSLRDFVLFERAGAASTDAPSWFFLDRFEVTRGDWAAFAKTPAGLAVDAHDEVSEAEVALPVGLVDLAQARAFAAWRFARLPRLDEWQFATVGDSGRNWFPGSGVDFPWGRGVDATRANTGELGLGEPTPVGTFESGRRAQGWPYDLVGNVSEWTETVLASWCSVVTLSAAAAEEDIKADQRPQLAWLFEVLYGGPPDEQWRERLVFHGDPRFLEVADVVEMSWPFARGRRDALRTAALAVWQQPGGLLPAVFAVAAAGAEVPREVVGADFLTPMNPDPQVGRKLVESVPAGDRRQRTGLRLCTTPRELLRALVAAEVTPTALDFEQLRRFVRRDRHHAVLAAAWPDVARQASEAELARPLGRWLSEQLVPRTGQ